VLCVTLYLHRYQAHRAVTFHPLLSHFCRLWLWLTTGIVTKAWTAIHRKHHAKCETKEDPHSPKIVGLKKVLWQGAELYRAEAKNHETLERYGIGTPDDWLERNIYTPHSNKGYFLTLLVDVILFGAPGITIWAIQMMTIPFLAAGIVNGVGHYFGYRNFPSQDASTNLSPFGILIGGEELHNNHHAYPSSAQFSAKWWEFDIGWLYLRLLSLIGLVKINRRIPKVNINKHKKRIDLDTLRAMFQNRYPLIMKYYKSVELPLKSIPLAFDDSMFVSGMKSKLMALWTMTAKSNNELLEYLHDWCKQAEDSNIKSLKEFVNYVRTYSL
jgi:stearoyl-CoA desaturase (delta-9 desaturase)